MLGLTKTQSRVLKFIDSFIMKNGYSPTYEEIGVALGYSSLATVHTHIRRLRERGYINNAKGQGRSISVNQQPVVANTVSLP